MNFLDSNFYNNIKQLGKNADIIYSALQTRDLPQSYKALEKLPRLNLYEGKPVMTTVFCGPSGAGKSTLFKLLTGLDVPAGGAVRPMSYASMAAVPEQIADNVSLAELFPGFELKKLQSPDELKKPDLADEDEKASDTSNILFYDSYKSEMKKAGNWLCLVDVPDFNTIEKSNWKKAELMIERADAVVFTVFQEAYANKTSFDILSKVLALSGSTIILLTKLESDDNEQSALEIRDDLIKNIENNAAFRRKRADGRSLAEFFKKSPFYYSCRLRGKTATQPAERLKLEHILPIEKAQDSFQDVLYGQEALETIKSKIRETVKIATDNITDICEQASDESKYLTEEINRVNNQLKKAAENIAGEEFPIFLLLSKVREMLEKNRPPFLARVFKPVNIVSSGLSSLINNVKEKINLRDPDKFKSSVHKRDDLEKDRLKSEVEKLVDLWRSDSDKYPDIDAEKARGVSDEILDAIDLPPVDEAWEEEVNKALEKWFESGDKNLWLWLNVFNDLAIFLGSVVVIGDIFIDGGIGTLGIAAVVGGSSALGGFLTAIFNNMGLSNEIRLAHNEWKKYRAKAYLEHLKKNLAEPLLFKDKLKAQEKLAGNLIEETLAALEEVKEGLSI